MRPGEDGGAGSTVRPITLSYAQVTLRQAGLATPSSGEYLCRRLADVSPNGALPASRPERSEVVVAYLMAGVQFVNVLDFMMVNPLGPQFSESLHIPTSQLPMIAGSYTAAASVTGVLGSLYLERFDRRTALFVALLGLAVGTAAGGFATGFNTLILARVVAGLFGGPATSLAAAIISDAIPPARRGWGIGVMMGGFSVASVLGVPAGLYLAHLGSWRIPFFGVALLVVGAAFGALRALPPLRAHLAGLKRGSPVRSLVELLKKKLVVNSLVLTTLTMMSGFIIIPNFPAFVQFNLGYPGEQLGLIYLVGGIVSLFTARIVGPLVDRFGSTRVAGVGAVLVVTMVYTMFVVTSFHVPVLLLSAGFFLAMGTRMVAYSTLTSKVPEPFERARFQSVQSAVQHAASAAAAFLSSQLLAEAPDHRLLHIERVAYVSMALALCVPLVMFVLEGAVLKRAHAEPEVKPTIAK
jgi:predicted MFS family arabinose efflux permease